MTSFATPKYRALSDVTGVQQLQWGIVKFGPARMLQYHKFILCKLESEDFEVAVNGRFRLSPTSAIDEVWHDHMLRPVCYFAYMKWLCSGKPNVSIIDHNPDFENDSEAEIYQRLQRTKEVWRNLFGDEMEAVTTIDIVVPTCRNSSLVVTGAASQSSREISFIVKSRTGKRISLNASLSTSILEVKEMIQDKEGIPVDQQRLTFDERELLDDDTLENCGVVEASVIDLIMRLRGC